MYAFQINISTHRLNTSLELAVNKPENITEHKLCKEDLQNAKTKMLTVAAYSEHMTSFLEEVFPKEADPVTVMFP